MARTQDTRGVIVTSALGPNVLLFQKMVAKEHLGKLFEIHLTLLSENKSIIFSQVVGTSIDVEIALPAGGTRVFNGLVSRFRQTNADGEVATYEATLVPWFWMLTRHADCRIFQEMLVPDIVKQVFRDNGFSDFEDTLTGVYRNWIYNVQYRESSFHFISRLMEQEGFYYYFKHAKGKNTLVLSDGIAAHAPFPGYATRTYRPDTTNRGNEYIHGWAVEQVVESGAFAHTDYDFIVPKKALKAQSLLPKPHANSTFEVYDYPGEYTEVGDGTNYATVRIEERHAGQEIVAGETDARGIAVGYLMTLTGHSRVDQNREYLIVSTDIEVSADEYQSQSDSRNSDIRFQCRFTAIDSKVQFRMPSRTPKSVVAGPQTAVVVGPIGEEIWTDKYGRVKVQFHWDRLGMKDDKSSCWIRVSQYWAGKMWGSIHIPRIGQEVIVDFLEGDPDQPIITGRVYNGEQMPPYTLPANQTQSGVKSRSSKLGTDQNFNEIRFEDKLGMEEVYVHAEKNMNRVVENNDTLKVGFEKKMAGDQTIDIHNNQKITVGNVMSTDGSQTIDIWKNRTETVHTGNETVTIKLGHRSIFVDTGNDLHQVKLGNRTTLVDTGNDLHQVKLGNRTTLVDTGNDLHKVGTGNRDTIVQMNDTHTINVGNRTVNISLGNDALTLGAGSQTVTIAAGQSTQTAALAFQFTVGPSMLKIDPSGITIKGPMITLSGMAMITASAPMIQIQGSGMVMMQGGLVMIN